MRCIAYWGFGGGGGAQTEEIQFHNCNNCANSYWTTQKIIKTFLYSLKFVRKKRFSRWRRKQFPRLRASVWPFNLQNVQRMPLKRRNSVSSSDSSLAPNSTVPSVVLSNNSDPNLSASLGTMNRTSQVPKSPRNHTAIFILYALSTIRGTLNAFSANFECHSVLRRSLSDFFTILLGCTQAVNPRACFI